MFVSLFRPFLPPPAGSTSELFVLLLASSGLCYRGTGIGRATSAVQLGEKSAIMTSNTVMPSWLELEEAMMNPEFSDDAQDSSVADEEAPPPDDIPPIPNIFKDTVSATKWADMSVVARAVHIEIGSRSMRNIQRQEAKKSLVRQQEMEDKEIRAIIAVTTAASDHATQQASAAVRHRDDLRKQYATAELAASEAARAVEARCAELAAEERRATALLAKRRHTERHGHLIPRQPLASPHLRSASRSPSPPPPELDQAPSSVCTVSAHTPEGSPYVYENDRQEGDSAFLGVLITDFASCSQPSFRVDEACEVKAAAAGLACVTDDSPFATLKDVLDHAVADPDSLSISAGGYRLVMALRSAHRSAISEVDWPRPPSVTTTLVGGDGQVYDTAERIRSAALRRALNQELSSRRDSDRTGGSNRDADRRYSSHTGWSLRHADRRDGRQSGQRTNRWGKRKRNAQEEG